jgi:hypothetical protein
MRLWPTSREGPQYPSSTLGCAGAKRDEIAVQGALITFICVAVSFVVLDGQRVLMPGPLSSAHGAITQCKSCHTQSGETALSWVHGLIGADPLADSKSCMGCHQMPETALQPHGAAVAALRSSTERLTKIAAQTPAPISAHFQTVAFPARGIMSRDLYCATCHQEHQGPSFSLKPMSNEQCRSCHVVKFDSFDGHHPTFENYPFRRRTRIIYDHAGHFGKHYPELAKKEPERRIPQTCSSCHDSQDKGRVMSVQSFDKTCSSCHLNQITGKERASGPKGIALLSVPGLDLATLRAKKAPIGEWPETSEAALTPFMQVMIGRSERGRAVLAAIERLNLQDLAGASEADLKAVSDLVWEIKDLFHKLVTARASDVLGDIIPSSGAKPSASLVADLTAGLPRDVVVSALQQWLPGLAAEMAARTGTPLPVVANPDTAQTGSGDGAAASDAAPSDLPPGTSATTPNDGGTSLGGDALAEGASDADNKPAPSAKLDPPTCLVSILGQCLVVKEPTSETGKITPSAEASDRPVPSPSSSGAASVDIEPLPGRMNAGLAPTDAMENRAARAPRESLPWHLAEGQPAKSEAQDAADPKIQSRWEFPGGTPRALKSRNAPKATPNETPASSNPGARRDDEAPPSATPAEAPHGTGSAASEPSTASTSDEEPKAGESDPNPGTTSQPTAETATPVTTGDQSDDLLVLTAEELRDLNERRRQHGKAARASASLGAPSASPAAASAPSAPVITIASDVDPETWAEFGGWYQQDFAIFYRPAGHKDRFLYTWLYLSGPQTGKDNAQALAAVFERLSGKDAQGACTKCHSVDSLHGAGKVVNFAPMTGADKQGRFTRFRHDPHFSIQGDRGCLTCHELARGRAYLKSYEHNDPMQFVSEFPPIKKEQCQTCHTAGQARQDCLTCHAYHVNGVQAPITNTRLAPP